MVLCSCGFGTVGGATQASGYATYPLTSPSSSRAIRSAPLEPTTPQTVPSSTRLRKCSSRIHPTVPPSTSLTTSIVIFRTVRSRRDRDSTTYYPGGLTDIQSVPGSCGSNGQGCTLVETTLVSRNVTSGGSSTKFNLGGFNVPAGFRSVFHSLSPLAQCPNR